MLQIGDLIPKITLDCFSAEGVSDTIKLREIPEEYFIIYFYPKDSTPGCTREACSFRDFFPKFKKLKCGIYGVSPDSIKSHEKFVTNNELPFALLSDPERKLATQLGVYKEKSMYGKKVMGIERSTFIFDSKKKLIHEFRNIKVDGHIEKVLNVVQALKAK
jgi:thioredoxin-dependent peroxiredoxin